MPKYRVSYVDSCLREMVVKAKSAEQAEELTRRQMEDGQHHHVADAWNDDWSVEPFRRHPLVNRRCVECGDLRQ